MSRRGSAVLLGLVGAVLVGGVSQTYLWRWGLEILVSITGSVFAWLLLVLAVAWLAAVGRVGTGAVAGALTGLAEIASYYGVQWLADGQHAAVAQFTRTGGPMWTVAALGGGALVGVLGAWAGLPGREHPVLKAVGLVTPAAMVGLGPTAWLLAAERYLPLSMVLPAAIIFAVVGIALASVAVRTCGVPACLRALGAAAASGIVLLGGLWVLETSGVLYLTF